MERRLTVRQACRHRIPLDGTDAQALEHALTITERERDEARFKLEQYEKKIVAPSYVHWSTKTSPIFTSIDEAVDCFLEDCDQSSELPMRLALYVYEPRRIEVDLQEAVKAKGWKPEWRWWEDKTEDNG